MVRSPTAPTLVYDPRMIFDAHTRTRQYTLWWLLCYEILTTPIVSVKPTKSLRKRPLKSSNNG